AGADYAWFNIWSPIERLAEQNQLTVLDARTLSMDDICEYNFTEQAGNGYAAIPAHNPNHRFFYFPQMKPGEVIIFKQFDSRSDKAMVCPHTAFYDPDVGDHSAARRSVEFRALCVFD
ncbi:MAG: CmcJ/NvfI family oxidoreductase, partial [Pseudomonadota bacterium]|nr:CmcJ/NvfI family oxidoreductase [Pseudomonadota bacterium]